MKNMKNPLIPQISRWLVMLCLVHGVDDTANAAALNVAISPPGNETFIEDTERTGEVIWFAEENLIIPASNYDVRVRFEISFSFADSDNIPIAPSISELLLIGWPSSFGTTAPWTFEWLSDSLDGPLNTWMWFAHVLVNPEDPRPEFQAGQNIARAIWATRGDDIDNVADESSFKMMSSVSVISELANEFLITQHAFDTKLLNPEPIPEPAVMPLFALGGLLIFRRRWRPY